MFGSVRLLRCFYIIQGLFWRDIMNCLNIHDVQKKQELCVEKCFKILFEYFFMNVIHDSRASR